MIYRSYQVKPFTWLKSYHHLDTYPSKVFSAWTEVSTIPCRPMAPITASGGSRSGRFFEVLGGLVISSSYQKKAFT